MKATGIIRRMDDLGRVVIPKELRKQVFGLEGLDSCMGVPFEFFIDEDSVVIKIYKEYIRRMKMNTNFKGYDRIGQSKINRQDCKMTIVEYKNSNKIVVEFDDENKTRVNTTYYRFSHGEVRNPNLKRL